MRNILLHFPALAFLPIGWGYVLLSVGLGLAERIDREGLLLTAEWKYSEHAWPLQAKFLAQWHYSLTVGLGIIFQKQHRHDHRVIQHEQVHVRQHTDEMWRSFLLGAVVWLCSGLPVLAGCIWISGGAWRLTNYLTATFRFGAANAYWDSEHERSAYAQTDTCEDGSSWLEAWEKRREDGLRT